MVSLTLSRTELPRRKDAPRLCTFTEGVRVRVWVRTDFSEFLYMAYSIWLVGRKARTLATAPATGSRPLDGGCVR